MSRTLSHLLAVALLSTTTAAMGSEAVKPQQQPVVEGYTAAASPTRFLQAHDRAAQEILAATTADTLTPKFREKMRAHIFSAFDFDELSRLSLGNHWEERTTEERAVFVRLSTRLVEEQNLDTFVSYYRRGATRYEGELVDGNTATVTATVPLDKGDHVEITYHLHRPPDGSWRVYDLAIDGASTADGNRRRYARYIKKRSYEALIEQLQRQLDKLVGLPPETTD